MLITDRPDWKLRLEIEDCASPEKLKEVKFIRESYNDEGKITNESTYQFFMTKKELIALSSAMLLS